MKSIAFVQDGVAISIAEDLVALLRGESEAGYQRMVWGGVEFGGILLGECTGMETVVRERLPVECEHALGPAFELSPKDEERLAAQLEQAGDDAVGWYRTTSRELALTAADEKLYNRRFPKTRQVALLIRRARNEVPRFAIIRRDGTGSPRVVAEFESSRALSAPPLVETQPPAAPEPPPTATVELPEAAAPEPQPLPTPELLPTTAVESPSAPAPEPQPSTTLAEFFGLRTAPFSQVADTEFFHPAKPHRDALAKLRYGIEARKGFLLLSGEAGTGKTLLLRCLMQQLEKSGIGFSWLLNSRVTVEEFFDWLAVDLELSCATRSKADVCMALVERLSARRTALLVDDAHKLSAELLEELELLGNLENRQGSLLPVVMAGDAALDETLEDYRHRSLKQRFVVRTRIAALNCQETASYIAARLQCAGWNGGVLFDESTVERIWQRTGGVPRLINASCESLLESAFLEGQRTVTVNMAMD